MTNIGERIAQRRKDLGMTAEDVAAALKVNRATVYRYESQVIEKLPSSILIPLAAVLRTTPAYLLGWDEDAELAQVPSVYEQEETAAALTRAITRMSIAERKKLLQMAKVMFPKAFPEENE